MKKNAPKILAVVLLSVVAVLMIVAGSGSLLDVLDKTPNSQGATSNLTDNSEQNSENNGSAPPSENEPTETPKEEPDYFPISATTDGPNRYMQTLSLEAPSLNAVHNTGSASYVIFTHATQEGPFKVAKASQTIVALDGEGTILSAISLQAPKETKYLSSQITQDGLVVVTKGENRSFVYTVTYDFSQVDLMELPQFSEIDLFALTEGFLLIGKSKENTVYKIKNNVVIASNTLQTGELKAVYDFSTHYVMFLSGINSYSVIKLSDSLKQLSTVTIPSKTLLSVEPVVEDGEQKYITVELSSTGVEIAKYPQNFSITNSERVGVGFAESADVFMNGESIFLLLHSTTDRLYLVDKTLNFTSSNNTAFQGISRLYDCSSSLGGYKVLYSKGEILTLVDVRNDGSQQSLNLDTKTDSAYISILANEELAIVYLEDNFIKIVGID